MVPCWLGFYSGFLSRWLFSISCGCGHRKSSMLAERKHLSKEGRKLRQPRARPRVLKRMSDEGLLNNPFREMAVEGRVPVRFPCRLRGRSARCPGAVAMSLFQTSLHQNPNMAFPSALFVITPASLVEQQSPSLLWLMLRQYTSLDNVGHMGWPALAKPPIITGVSSNTVNASGQKQSRRAESHLRVSRGSLVTNTRGW